MTITQLFLEQLEREAPLTRRALESVPKGNDDWKPHAKSMPLMRLAGLIAFMPAWIDLVINREELDLNPPGGKGVYEQPGATELVGAHEKAVSDGRSALSGTTDDYLLSTSWKLLAGGKVVMEAKRHIVIADTFTHLAHHRGQLTVYLRLLEQKVPALYGPSADDRGSFG